MRKLVLVAALVAAAWLSPGKPALAQGCGQSNPNCIVQTAPTGTSNNQAASTQFVQNALHSSLPLPAGEIWIGSAGNIATPQTFSGDGTLSIAGVFALLSVNTNVGSFGSATQCPSFTVNAKGLITAASQVTCTPALGSITGLGSGVPAALALGINTAGGPVVPTAALTAFGVVYGGGSGVTPGSTAAGTSGQLFLGVTSGAPQWGTMSGDATISNTGALTLAAVNSNTGPFGSATQCVTVTNNAKGLTTAVSATTCTPAISSIAGLGTGNATLLGIATGSAGGPTQTIAGGATAMGTGAIASGACATTVTATATNVATTDVVTASFNGNPTAVTGYVPLTSGMLTILIYPTSGNVNFAVCNNTASSITPGALTLNWRVVR